MDFNVRNGLPREPRRIAERLPAEPPLLAGQFEARTDSTDRRFCLRRIFLPISVGEPARRDAERHGEALDGVDAGEGLAALDEEGSSIGPADGTGCGGHAQALATASLSQPVGQAVVGGVASSSDHMQDITGEKPRVQLRAQITSQKRSFS